MKGKVAPCAWSPAPQQQPWPRDRCKHACAACRGFLYLYGGRSSTSLRDFWRYNLGKNEWEMLDCSKDGPEELEEHSMVAYKSTLYIFGGMVDSPFTQAKTPLWIYDTDSARWTECPNVPAEPESSAPRNRKGHSAVVYHSSMYIYGGYFGIRGISQEFWTFHFDTRKWLCVSSPSASAGPGPRHGHSAVVYHTAMYLFGGLMGLSEQKDLWKWDFGSSSWSNVRTSQGPPPVVGHASIVFKDSMLIVGGGISNSSPMDDLWKYHFHTQTWKKLSSTAKANLPPKMYHCILGIGRDFQTTSDVPSTFPSDWKQQEEQEEQQQQQQQQQQQLVAIPKQTDLCSYFCQRPAARALGDAMEMKTFSLPLETGAFCAFQTAPGAAPHPNRATTSTWAKEESLHPFVLSEEETGAGAQIAEGADHGDADVVDGVVRDTNVLLLIGGRPLSSFSEISFWQLEFDSLSLL